MLIVSQDKKQIVNLRNTTRIFIEDFSKDGDGFGIGADTNSAESQCWDLGYYATEKRAKDILEEIVNKYKEYATISNMTGNDVRGIYNIPKIYEMPKE